MTIPLSEIVTASRRLVLYPDVWLRWLRGANVEGGVTSVSWQLIRGRRWQANPTWPRFQGWWGSELPGRLRRRNFDGLVVQEGGRVVGGSSRCFRALTSKAREDTDLPILDQFEARLADPFRPPNYPK